MLAEPVITFFARIGCGECGMTGVSCKRDVPFDNCSAGDSTGGLNPWTHP